MFTIYVSPRHHNSQALAGFGIASSATPDASRAEGGDDFFSAFSEGGGTMGSPSSSGNIQGRILSGGGGGLKGERERVSSVDVSDLLRATRLRGGGRRASRPAVRETAPLMTYNSAECLCGCFDPGGSWARLAYSRSCAVTRFGSRVKGCSIYHVRINPGIPGCVFVFRFHALPPHFLQYLH